MSIKLPSRGVVLAVLAATVIAAGLGARTADAQASAVVVHGPYTVTAGVPAQVSGAANVGSLAEAYWFFSDGESARGLTITRTFYAPGVYTATLTVR